ncbi:hypothetical protein ELH42_04305 [Rhizobium ruizarguesonis]|nr:hypothetical protein [Rhizobium ruizarguesonis]NEI29503.1 hypothetical protein [Rhizobium ruizarguesonis]TAY92599.1 hypothetical protein ELH85_05150 [Rhizobium ruizarguesonis]TBA03748.1 hypothetical protein ELH64_04675 [Rhizobium ruizarguesonis]TBA25159.1 hypothetical protein ELH61_04825 [Rhizobium ruizarguesonis]
MGGKARLAELDRGCDIGTLEANASTLAFTGAMHGTAQCSWIVLCNTHLSSPSAKGWPLGKHM